MATSAPEPFPNEQAHTPPTPEDLIDRLTRLLDLEALEADLYRGARQPSGRGRVFGGQVIAQALTAAMRSVDTGAAAHSLHAYFMRPGDEDLPIVYRVERDFEGRSFSTRRVIALQRDQPILTMAASFQRAEDGFAHQVAMPQAPAPETLIDDREFFRRERERNPKPFAREQWFSRPRPIEVRSVTPRSLTDPTPREPQHMSWFRAVASVGDDANVHRAILAYASDMGLLGASMLPHGVTWASPGMQIASLDHALWLHESFRVDEWLLYVTDSPWTGHARGFNHGQVFSRDGRLVASVAQEGLIRRRSR